jgi:toxin HigB-1
MILSVALIRSFKGKFAEVILLERQVPRGFSFALAKVARRKLVQLNNARTLGDARQQAGSAERKSDGQTFDPHQ